MAFPVLGICYGPTNHVSTNGGLVEGSDHKNSDAYVEIHKTVRFVRRCLEMGQKEMVLDVPR